MNFLKNFAEKAKSVTDSPSRSFPRSDGESHTSPTSPTGTVSQQEGFICPLCIASFASPEALHSHYELNHTVDTDITSHTPNVEKRFGSLNLLNNQNEKDDRVSLRSAFGGSETSKTDDEEKSFYSNQVKALEEAKSLLSSEVISLRQKLAQKEQENVPNGRVFERANELASENVGLKAAIDEITGLKESVEERLHSLELEKVNRICVDDSAVLKQELVNVQKAMDDTLTEKETEYITLKATYDDIFYEKQQMVDVVTRKDKELVDLQIKLKKVMDNNENTLSKEGQEINDILKSEVHILSKEAVRLKEGFAGKESVIKSQKHEIASLSKTVESKTTEIEEIQEANKQLKVSLENCNVLSKTQNDEVDEFKKSINSAQKEVTRLLKQIKEDEENEEGLQMNLLKEKEEKESLKSECARKDTLLNEAQSVNIDILRELQKLKTDLKQKEEDNERFMKEKEELMAKIEAGEGINMAIQQLNSENSILQDRLQENTKSFQDKESKYSTEIEQLRIEIVSLKQDAVKIKDEEAKSRDSCEEKDKIIKKLELSISELNHRQKECGDEIENMISNHKTAMNKIQESLSTTANDLQEKDTSLEKLKRDIDNAEKDLLIKEDYIEEMSIKIKSFEEEKEQLSFSNTILQEDSLRDKNTIDRLQNDLNGASDKEVELELKTRNLEERCLQDTENIKILKQAKTLFLEEKVALETDIQEKTTMCNVLNSKNESKDTRIKQLEIGLSETEVKVKEMQQVIEDALGKELNLLSDIEEKNKTIFAIEEEKSNIVISFESQQTIIERLTSEKDVAEKDLRKNKTELQSLEESICQLQSDIEKERIEIKDEVGELRTARELLLSQVVDLKNEKENVKSVFENDKEKSRLNIEALEQKLQECQKSLDKITQDLQKENALNTENQQKAKESIIMLESRLDTSNSEGANLSTEIKMLNENMTILDKERDLALSKTLELEAAVGSANEERRGLLERCVAAEAETERTRNMTVELRRKLDDAQAALHELGRENQSIQVELVKQSGRKWKDDTEVVSCSSCQAGFGITNRKHHCRNCGNIFCNECSSKQANMTGYKKPQRVCEGCFGELGSK